MTYFPNLKDNLTPTIDDGYSVGSPTMRWKDGYFGNDSLHIVSTALETGVATDWNFSSNSDGYLTFSNVNDGYLVVTRFGNVGIGTTHPTQKLQVDGYVKATPGFIFGDGSIMTSAATGSGSGTIGGSIATNQVAFGSATNTIAGNAAFNWDNTNKRFGVGANSAGVGAGAGNDFTLTVQGVNPKATATGTNVAFFGSSDANASNPLGLIIKLEGGTNKQVALISTETNLSNNDLLLQPNTYGKLGIGTPEGTALISLLNVGSTQQFQITSSGNVQTTGTLSVGANAPGIASADAFEAVILGTNAKTVAADEDVLFIGSSDAIGSNPIGLDIGYRGAASQSGRRIYLQGTQLGLTGTDITLNANGGNVSVGSFTTTSMFNVGTAAQFQVASDGQANSAHGILVSGALSSIAFLGGVGGIGFDYVGSSTARLFSLGPDNATLGIFRVDQSHADGSGQNIPLYIDASGRTIIMSGTTPPSVTSLFNVGNSAQFQVKSSGNILTTGTLSLGSTAIDLGAPTVPLFISAATPSIFFRNSSAATDQGTWQFDAESNHLDFNTINDAFNSGTAYFRITRSGADVTSIDFRTGTVSAPIKLQINTTETVFNSPGSDFDFRVAGVASANLLFGDASTSRIGIKTNTPVDALEVVGGIHATGTAAASKANDFFMDMTSGTGRLIVNGPDNSTNGTLQIKTQRADSSNTLTILAVDTAGLSTFSNAVTFSGAALFTGSVSSGASVNFVSGAGFVATTGTAAFSSPSGGAAYDYSSGAARIITRGVDNSTNGGFTLVSQRADGSNSNSYISISSTGDATFTPLSGHTSDALTIAAGTLATTKSALKVTATTATSSVEEYGVLYRIAAGGSTARHFALRSELISYSGSAQNWAGGFVNLGTGTGSTALTGGGFNTGLGAFAIGTTTGDNVGVLGNAEQGDRNIGIYGYTPNPKANAKSIAVFGRAENTASGGINIGGLFTIDDQTVAPDVTISAALIADNGNKASSIFIARDGGSPKFSIIDGGAVEMAEISAPGTPASGFGRIYVKSSDSSLYFKDDSGTEFNLTSPTGTGANTSLSNLVSTSINTSLIPAVNDGYNIGSASLIWKDGYFEHVRTTGYLEVAEVSTPPTPSSGFGRYYAKSDNKPYFINDAGTEFDLTADVSASIGGTITGATAGSVLFAGAGSTLAQDNANFFWNNTDKVLVLKGHGAVAINSVGSTNGGSEIRSVNSNGGSAARSSVLVGNADGSDNLLSGQYGYLQHTSAGFTTADNIVARQTALIGADTGGILFKTDSGGGAPIKMAIDSNLAMTIDNTDVTASVHVKNALSVGTGVVSANAPIVAQVDHNAGTLIAVANNTSGAGAFSSMQTSNATVVGRMQAFSAGINPDGLIQPNAVAFEGFDGGGTLSQVIFGTRSNAPATFYTNNLERARFAAAGNFTIGSTTATSMFNVGSAAQFQVTSNGLTSITPSSPTDHVVAITSGILASTKKALQVTSTLSSTTATQAGVRFDITGAGSGSNFVDALRVSFAAGYTGTGSSIAGEFGNSNAGTGTDAIGDSSNFGVWTIAAATTTGHNTGAKMSAIGGVTNIGSLSLAGSIFFGDTDGSGRTSVGTVGLARTNGSSPVAQVGGYFGLNTSTPTFTNAALIADNSDQTAPIFLGRDNGTTVFAIIDGGSVGIKTAAPASVLEVNGSLATVIATKSANYTLTINDSKILVDASSGVVTITLPLASTCAGREYHIKKKDSSANNMVINTTSSDTIDGDASVVSNIQYRSYTVTSDGSNWFLI